MGCWRAGIRKCTTRLRFLSSESPEIPKKHISSANVRETNQHNRLSACFIAVISVITKWFSWFKRTKEHTATVYPAPATPVLVSESAHPEPENNEAQREKSPYLDLEDYCASGTSSVVSSTGFEFIGDKLPDIGRVSTSNSWSSFTSTDLNEDILSNGDGFKIFGSKTAEEPILEANANIVNVPSVDEMLRHSLLQRSPRPRTQRALGSYSNSVGTLTILQICNLLQKPEDLPDSPSFALHLIDNLNANTTTANTSTSTHVPNTTAYTAATTATTIPSVEKVSIVPVVPVIKELSIGPNLVATSKLESFMAEHKEIEIITMEFDLRQNKDSASAEQCFLLLETIFNNPQIQELRVRVENWRNHILQQENILPPEGWEFGRNGFRVTYSIRVKTLVVHYPGLSLRHLLKWRIFLNSQDRLVSLICNLDSVSWTLYKKVLRKNESSLTRLELYNITNHNGDIQNTDLFDWTVLNDLWNLSSLKLWGDTRYYGLRTVNFEEWKMERLEEIELKYVDCTLDELKHLLNAAEELRIAVVQFFIPIPDQSPTENVSASEFLYLVACALAERKVHQLIFLDYKLPGPLQYRREYLRNASELYRYKSKWSGPENMEYDFMEFQIRDVE